MKSTQASGPAQSWRAEIVAVLATLAAWAVYFSGIAQLRAVATRATLPDWIAAHGPSVLFWVAAAVSFAALVKTSRKSIAPCALALIAMVMLAAFGMNFPALCAMSAAAVSGVIFGWETIVPWGELQALTEAAGRPASKHERGGTTRSALAARRPDALVADTRY